MVSAILLAGGKGIRMNSTVPKQFMKVNSREMALYSFEVFLSHPKIEEVIVVCPEGYRYIFKNWKISKKVLFADPGDRRQDSFYNALIKSSEKSRLICVHDAARPMITHPMIDRALKAAEEHGASVVGMPVKFTVKEVTQNGYVKKTLDRSKVMEIQTPQIAKRDLFFKGFEIAKNKNLTVTDDVALVELLGLEVKVVQGSNMNIKVTSEEDLAILEALIQAITPPKEMIKDAKQL